VGIALVDLKEKKYRKRWMKEMFATVKVVLEGTCCCYEAGWKL